MMKKSRKAKARTQTGPPAAKSSAGRTGHFPVVGLGASAGGLEAFGTFLKALAPNTGMGFVLIQHMEPKHESVLATLLQQATPMPVRNASNGTIVEPNHVYVLPANSLGTISGGALSLTSRGPRSYRDYPIDHFFLSLADDLKNRAIGMVLSGTASDGTRGLLAIKAAGGITFAQDIDSAQFPSMPASAVASGCVDFILPPDKIANELSRIKSHPYIRRAPAAESAPIATLDGLPKILRQLHVVTGVDVEAYKPTIIGRRIARRMALHKLDTHDQYFRLISKGRTEVDALFEDIFTHVTGFFRDPENLRALQRRVLFHLIPDKASRSVRIWVPGCSSGEEVYSLAMLLFETLGKRRAQATIQIFGTDISERSVQRARAGVYPPSSMVDVSAERQHRFFSRVGHHYQITKAIRDVCVFARHDLSKDPPFSRMDLISCRNILVHMGPALQKSVVAAFHYALKPGGHLLLGKSESPSPFSSLFGTVDFKHRILVRRELEGRLAVRSGLMEKREAEKAKALLGSAPPLPETRREAERFMLDRYAPPAIVVDSNLQIIHFHGDTGAFLSPAPGDASFHLWRMIGPELLVDVRSGIYQAKKKGETIQKDGIRFRHNGESSIVDITVAPLKTRHANDNDYLIVFREKPASRATPRKPEITPGSDDGHRAELAGKEQEITSLHAQLQDLVQHHEASDEEVRTMHEEILSSNEELQSTNEELETAKEELESTNEELGTLNDELQKRNTDLTRTMDDLSNVLVAVDIPIVILDSNLRIRRFTPAAGAVLNLIPTDIGRPLSDIASTLPSIDWKDLATRAVEHVQPFESEVQDKSGHWYTLRLRPYRSSTDRVDGILIALVDVDLVKRSTEEAAEARRRTQDLEARIALVGESLRIGLWELDLVSKELRGTPQWSRLYGVAPKEVLSLRQWLARVHPDDRPSIEEELHEIVNTGKASSMQYRVIWPDRSVHWLNRRAELVRDAQGNPALVRGVSIDINDQKLVEEERRSLVSRIASAQELERRRIARELHDGLVQDLAGIAMELGRHAAVPPARAELQRGYKRLQNHIVEAAESARHVAYELHPTELEDLGLDKALRRYSEQLAAENKIAIAFTSSGVPPDLHRDIASCLYKVAQESLRNVIKHSNASRVRVSIKTNDKKIKLCVEDNGQGFRLSTLQGSDGLGVAGMRERVQLVNGKFNIQTERGKHTTVIAEVELREPEPSS
jgi:two-component system CheB/CheR fusion protein